MKMGSGDISTEEIQGVIIDYFSQLFKASNLEGG